MSPVRCVNGSCIIRDAPTVTCSRWTKRWTAFGWHGEENRSEKALKVYLLAYRSVHSEEEYRKRQEDLKTDEMVRQETDQALKSFAGLPEQHIASGETDRILEDLTREYHRSTGS